MIRASPLVLAAAIASAYYSFAFAENTERDSCACKVVEVGATSTLKGGTCVRTEASHCLMEWNSGSTQFVSVGNGLPQSEAETKGLALVTKAAGSLRLEKLDPFQRDSSPPRVATSNLNFEPPEKYDDAILNSYVLLAATALTRFDVPAGDIATSLLKYPGKFLSAVKRRDSSETIDALVPMTVTYGCLQIHGDKEKTPFRIFIKTPFASTKSC